MQTVQATRGGVEQGTNLDNIEVGSEIVKGSSGSQVDKVISFEAELKMLQDDNMYPKDIFLQHCQQFAKSNFSQMNITVEEYQITQQNLDDKVFFRESKGNKMNGEDGADDGEGFYADGYSAPYYDRTPTRKGSEPRSKFRKGATMVGNGMGADQPVNVEDEYDILDIKIFPEVVLVNGKQQLIVKTWELIEKRKQGQQQTIQTKNHPFHLKTLRIYDSHSKERAQILTEQVDTKINSKLFYDTSILQYKDSIFYFKRIYGTLDDSFSDSRKSGSLKARSRSMDEDEDDLDESETFTNSYLQLFKYDLVNFVETQIEGYQLVEYNDDDRTFNIIFSQNFDINDQLLKLDYKDEDEFLMDQYFLAQQYIHDDEEESFAIFCMNNFDEPIHHESPDNQDQDISTTKQIQYFNHREIMLEQNHKILFVMISQQQHMHLIHDLQKCESDPINVFRLEKTFDRYQNPKLHIHTVTLNYQSEGNKWISIEQQYFIDQRNKVHLMYPNEKQKSTKYKHIDLIKEITKLDFLDQRLYKKIISIDYTQHMDNVLKKTTFIQPIKSLKKILNFSEINQDQIFTFCKDPLDQVLYITQPDVNQIYLILMRDHHCEECYDPKVADIKHEINHLMSDYMLDNFQKFNFDMNQRQSKKSLTRMKKMRNHCEGRFKGYNIDDMMKDGQSSEQIELDIDTQRILITRKQVESTPLTTRQSIASLAGGTSKLLAKSSEKPLNQTQPGCYYVMIEDYKGTMHKIILFESNFIIAEELATETIQQNGNYYIFVFSALNYINGEKKKTYLVLRKSVDFVENLIQDTMHGLNRSKYQFKHLIEANEEMQIITPGPNLRTIKFLDIYRYQVEKERSGINISFERLVDINVKLNFVSMVYYESYNIDNNYLMIFDIDSRTFTRKLNINPNATNLRYLYMDDQGYSCFKICRSSEMISEFKEKKNNIIQQQKFQVFTFYIETLGRIQIQEYLVKHTDKVDPATNSPYIVQLIGQKQIFMSNKCIKMTDWNYLKKSIIIPFFDEEHIQQGCQCILQHNQTQRTTLNLIDQEVNNLYSYQSDIVTIGSKRFELNKDDHEEFLLVISAKINDEIIRRNILDQQESFKILRVMQEILMAMRKPDLEYVLLNSFDSLLKLDFFTPQEILFGKSLCDICLSDPNKIKQGLETFQKNLNKLDDDMETHIQKSVIEELLQGDNSRTKSFKDVEFYPKKMIVNFDFNFNTTIYRGLRMKSMQSIKYLLDFLFDECNSHDYYKLVMLDLHEIMSSKINSKFLYFFEESPDERQSIDRTQFCNMEVPYSDTDIEQFSQFSKQFEPIEQFKNIHDIKAEIKDIILQRMARQRDERLKQRKRQTENTEYPIEHSYVDLNWLVIGEKMRAIKDEQRLKNLRFDHLFYADMILQQYNEMSVFNTRTIQKIIDFQFTISSQFMKVQFWFYVIFYVFPYSLTLVTEDHEMQLQLFQICIFPQVVLMGIKLIQLKVQKCNFISGWNIIDVLQIINFQVLLQLLQTEKEEGVIFKIDPFVKIWLILLTFLKVIHFIIVYEEFGFFIKMITQSLYDLRPFFICYIFFVNFFVILYAVMEVEIDGELLTKGSEESLGYYGLLFLTVWRNSVGKLGAPNYVKLAKQDTSIIMPISVGIIWAIYFVQILFMLVIGLNFMIAIIESTFSSVNDDKMSYLYRNKAEMNLESFEILQYFPMFGTLNEYRAIIFSTFTDQQDDKQIVVHGREEEIEIMLEKIEQMMQNSFEVLHEQLDYCQKLDGVISNQLRLQQRITKEYETFTNSADEFKMSALQKISKFQKQNTRRFTVY